MIFGVGADILRVDRVERMLQRHGERFPKRILTPLEWQRWERVRGKKKNPAQYLALRFAGKEAVAKAPGLGLRPPANLSQIGIVNDPGGKPVVAPEENLRRWLEQNGVERVHVSLSDESDAVVAFAVAESGR